MLVPTFMRFTSARAFFGVDSGALRGEENRVSNRLPGKRSRQGIINGTCQTVAECCEGCVKCIPQRFEGNCIRRHSRNCWGVILENVSCQLASEGRGLLCQPGEGGNYSGSYTVERCVTSNVDQRSWSLLP